MKKLLALIVLVSIFLSLTSAAFAARTKEQELDAVRNYTRQLELKLAKANDVNKRRQLESLIQKQRIREAKLIREIEGPGPEPVVQPVTPVKEPKLIVITPEEKRPTLEMGLGVGLVAGMTGAIGNIRFNDPMDIKRGTLKVGLGYAQGADTAGLTRKHVILFVDWIYRLVPFGNRGIWSYLGGGFNYDAYTTGQVSGSAGGQAYYGIEGRAGAGSYYAEAGYGLVRTGFSPNYSGVTLLVGYRIGVR
ncbi:MAG: hypothetical protein KKB81_06135 [Candidatus Margulisbacteria bacterium]|nr:hypothetical protein [Candidatus Margulisiibacteriota bacterium]MBU1021438.1 hypothetical protein [Candidatus Margulisiibacteriota bacterium]MBU1728359.1 hypothetical protein [Candidatus Margulisiibacteriota bacterium]MBU1955898.1 hypothetical protein [Candidatus Margulisiibacteriota bacterium]